MLFQLYILGNKFMKPLYFTDTLNLVEKKPLSDQYQFVVKYKFTDNSFIFVNPYTGNLLCDSPDKSRKILDDTTFFNNSITLPFKFLPVEIKNFRIIWSNLALKHLFTLEPSLFSKMNYIFTRDKFSHHSVKYVEQEKKQIIETEKKKLETLEKSKKCIITIGVLDKNLLYSNFVDSFVKIKNHLYYDINNSQYLEKLTHIQYLNNIGFLYYSNIDTIYINSFKEINFSINNIDILMLDYCIQNGYNFIIHDPEHFNFSNYEKNFYFVWTSFDDYKKYIQGKIACLNSIYRFWDVEKNNIYHLWQIASKNILKKEKCEFSLFYNHPNVINPISKLSFLNENENILPEFLDIILTKLANGVDLSTIFNTDILDYSI